MMSSETQASELLEQGIITLPIVGDVLVMVFADCIRYVPGDLIDGKFFQFKPSACIKLQVTVNPADVVPFCEHRGRLRRILMLDYANNLSQWN